jgi:hypothetical protein
MEKKSLITLVFVAVTILSGVVNARSKAQPGRLTEVEKYISQRRKATEDSYQRRIAELRLRAEKEIKLFEEAEQAKLAKAELVKKAQHFENWGFMPTGTLLSNEEAALAESRIAQKEKKIMESLEQDVANLERKKKHALTVRLAGFEKQLKEDVLKPKPEPTHGVVKAIVYSKDKQTALIDKEIAHPGDTIHGVKIVKINLDNVEFEKNGKLWKQKVGGTAEAFWQ